MIFLTLILSSILILSVPSICSAQFPDLSQLGSKNTPSPLITNLTRTADQLTGNYAQSNKTMTDALGKLLSSLGAPAATTTSLSSLPAGANASVLKNNIDAAAAFLKERLKKSPQLTSAEGQQLNQGMLTLANGMSSLRNLVPSLNALGQQAQKAMGQASLQDKLGLQGILAKTLPLTQRLPQDLASYKSVLTTLAQLAQSNNIKLPGMVQALIK